MKQASFRLPALAAACLLAAWPRPAAAYIKFEPPTLGDLCRQATHIYVLQVERVEKVSADKFVICFKSVESLKVQGVLPDGALAKQFIAPNVNGLPITGPNGAKVILDWAAEGKTAVLFAKIDPASKKPREPALDRPIDLGGNVRAHVYIDGYWYWIYYDGNSKCWVAVNGEPTMLTRYCGTADKLRNALTQILRGEEVVVPAMVGDNKQDLEQRRAKVQDLRASLTILDDNSKPKSGGDKKPDNKNPEAGDKKAGEKKPGDPQPEGKKAGERTPGLVGSVTAVAGDGKSFTLLRPPTEKNNQPAPIEIQIREYARIMAGKEPGKLAVGQTVNLWFAKGTDNVAVEIQIGKLPEQPEKKPAPEDKGKKLGPGAPAKKPDGNKPAPANGKGGNV